MSTGRPNSFPLLPTLLLSLFLGAVIGVLLLLLFRGPKNDTVSAVNGGVAGTTVTQSANTQTDNTQSGGTTGTATDGAASTGNNGTVNQETALNSDSSTGDTSTSQSGTNADSQSEGARLSQTVDGTKFSGNGQELYVQACQACHQAGGVGARGAGIYPPLANNPKLNTAAYPISLVMFGNGGMPGFGHYLTDQQITDVVNYIRSDLNKNTDQVTPEDVKKLRPSTPDYMIFGEAAG